MELTATFAFALRQTPAAWKAARTCFSGRAPDLDAYEQAMKGLIQSDSKTHSSNGRKMHMT